MTATMPRSHGWFWQKIHSIFHYPVPEPPPVTLKTKEAVQARENARLALREIEKTGEEVIEVSTSLRERREENHFGEGLLLAMKRRTST